MDGEKQPAIPDNQAAQWQYAVPEETPQVAWTASEFVAHEKGFFWYVALLGGAGVLAGGLYLISKDVVAAAIIVIISIIFVIAGARKPRVLEYMLTTHGLQVEKKLYPYAEFKSFSIMDEGAFSSIMFAPLKRFMPPISIYYDPADEDKIVETLAVYLPIEDRQHDLVDRLIDRLRF